MFLSCFSASSGSSGATYIKPPDTTIEWDFDGGQAINVSFTNNHILVGIITYSVRPSFESGAYIIFPFCSQGKVFSHFDYVPIRWRFDLSSPQDVAFIGASATWEDF